MFLPICLQISLLLVCSMSPTCLTIGLGCLCRCSAALYIPLLLVCLTHNTPSPNVGTGCKRSNPLSFVSSSCFFDIVICDFQHLAHCNLFFSILTHRVRCFIPADWPCVRLSATILLPPPAASMQHCASICDATQRLLQAADSFQQVCSEFQCLKSNFNVETNFFALAVLVRHGRIG